MGKVTQAGYDEMEFQITSVYVNVCFRNKKFLLLSYPFDYHDDDLVDHHKGRCYQVHIPLSVAVSAGAMKVSIPLSLSLFLYVAHT